ncbi:MAG: hypothetical protein COU10_01685 [Candidatus Harrisonbacteria bacterium CG10_big_fil_rev_8_21_14_0_10_45_28]|uniref:Uncharacterized protein n=1 Tax=Candidatus Harrisonbacteria bacterium CG10_big_fil_rev_8_21_14_0_10_45_28 TaxID=1974586 RepID=A0A2H0UNI6_9BACT|nr:MAG: hypothetical protein COU10_01685 [Candidatus Harrisonbacteria bacterium CG10_big_fil_rev_8_21_14_0_10_45_28]
MIAIERHCQYRYEIREEDGRNAMQEALTYPHLILSYTQKEFSGRITAHCRKYISIIKRIDGKKVRELLYWEIVLKRPNKARKRIATAYITSSPEYAMINNRIEKVEFQRKYISK